MEIDKNISSETSNYRNNLDSISFYTDPATIGLLIKWGQVVYSLFASKRDSNKVWFIEISSQLNRIEEGLILLIDIVRRLHLDVRDELNKIISDKLMAKIAVIDIQNIRWRRERDKFLYTSEIQREIEDQLSNFMEVSRELMMKGKGHYESIAFAMRVELYLMLLKETKERIPRALMNYKSYFVNCIDPNTTSSITNIQFRINQTIDKLKNETPSGRFKLRSYKTGTRCSGYMAIVTEYQVIDGDLISGFNFKMEREEQQISDGGNRDCRFTNNIDYRFNDDEMINFSDTYHLYNQKHFHYKNVLEPNLKALDTAQKKVTLYINLVDNFLSQQ